VFALPLRLAGIIAQDIAAPSLAVTDDHFLGLQVLPDGGIAAGLGKGFIFTSAMVAMRVASRYLPQARPSSSRLSAK
jgi:uncharacterized protein YaiI (UPF0178 family)